MAKVASVQEKQDLGKGLLSAVMSAGGQAVGTAYGGPVGGAIGGKIGGMAGDAIAKPSSQNSSIEQASSPVDRRMTAAQQDPMNQLKEGKSALASMDPDTQATLSPVIDEAIKKAAAQRQQAASGGY